MIRLVLRKLMNRQSQEGLLSVVLIKMISMILALTISSTTSSLAMIYQDKEELEDKVVTSNSISKLVMDDAKKLIFKTHLRSC